jgi:hypothetical protein
MLLPHLIANEHQPEKWICPILGRIVSKSSRFRGNAAGHRQDRRHRMNFTTAMGFAAGVLQFVVAGYALWLNRHFGTRRVGWTLFWAFLLLAFLHLMQPATRGGPDAEFLIKIDMMNVLISLLLLIGLFHLGAVLKERARVEREEQRMRDELESEVKKKTAYLTRALDELQTEIDERKRVETEAQTVRWELNAVSHRAEMAQLASNVLQSVNVSANLISDQVKQSRIANVVRIGALIREHSADLGEFMTQDPRGQKLPVYIAQLAQHLSAEQIELLDELDAIKDNLKKIMIMQQDYIKLAEGADATPPVNCIPAIQPMTPATAA